eukprot:325736-Heterocapsa_arctica.AAC.1
METGRIVQAYGGLRSEVALSLALAGSLHSRDRIPPLGAPHDIILYYSQWALQRSSGILAITIRFLAER